MKNLRFQGIPIIPANQPAPKIGQVWQYEDNSLVKVIQVNKQKGEILSAVCLLENNDIIRIGGAWFNGKEYTFIGTILK